MGVIGPMLSQFVLILFSALAGTAVIQIFLGRKSSLVNYRLVPSLPQRSAEEREHILRTAQREAFRGWRVVLAALPISLAMAVGATAAFVLKTYALGPNALWFRALIAGGIGGLATLPASRLMTTYVARYVARSST